MIRVDIGLLRGRKGGVAILESSRRELEEKREPKRLAFTVKNNSFSITKTERRREVRFAKVDKRYSWLRTRNHY